MRALFINLSIAILSFPAVASTKLLDCLQTSTKNITQAVRVVMDDNSNKAEVTLYAVTADCAKNNSCPTYIYRKEVLPSVIRLSTGTESPDSMTLIRLLEIDRQSLAISSRFFVGSTSKPPTMILSGTCKLTTLEEKRKL